MSDHLLRLIPKDVDLVPRRHLQDQLEVFLRQAFPQSTQIELKETQHRQFIDPGTNLVGIYCPNCRSQIPRKWWNRAMRQAFSTGFEDLRLETPCCDFLTTLDELVYEGPAGFARFVADIWNPLRDLDPIEKHEIERILGKEVRLVHAHY